MSEKKSFIARVVDRFFHRSKKQEHNKRRSLQVEALEVREMLTAVGFHSVHDAIEGSENGYFRLERDNIEGQLQVRYQIDLDTGGADLATHGTDFHELPGMDDYYGCMDGTGYVTFQDGQRYVDIVIRPIDDSIVEGNERVQLSLYSDYSCCGMSSGGYGDYTIDPLRRTATLVIQDNDVTSTVWIDSVVTASEPSGTGKFIFKRSNTDKDLTIAFTFDSTRSTATYNTDFTLSGMNQYSTSSGTVKFLAGSDTAEIVLTVKDDALAEGDETVILQLSDPTKVNEIEQYTLDHSRRRATLLIHDNDSRPTVWMDSVVHASESSGVGKFILKRTDVSRELTVSFSFDSSYSTATFNDDFTMDGMPYEWDYGTVTFAVGSDTAEIVVRPKDDQTVEQNETVTVTLYESYYGDSTYDMDPQRRSATLLIVNDDAAPLVWVDTVVHATEPLGQGKVTLKRTDTANELRVAFSFDSARSTATFNQDFTITGQSYEWDYGYVTFAAGSDTAEILVNVLADSLVENPETVYIRLIESSDSVRQYELDQARGNAVVLINDDNTPSTVWIESVVHASEPSGQGQFIMKRTETAKDLTVTFTYDSSRSTATFGTDFTIDGLPYSWSTGQVTFLAGSDTAAITVSVLADTSEEPDETIAIRLTNPSATNGAYPYNVERSRQAAILVIPGTTTPAEAPRVWIETVEHGTETSGVGRFIFKRSGELTNTLAVNFVYDSANSTATFGTDFTVDGLQYSNSTGTLTFAAGSDTATVFVRMTDDSTVETTESVGIRINTAPTVGGIPTYVIDESQRQRALNIVDNDTAPRVWIDSIVDGIEGSRNAKVIVKRDNADAPLSVVLQRYSGTASANNDFVNFNDVTLTFEAGRFEAEYEITILDNTTVEREETIIVRLRDPNPVSSVLQYTLDQTRREATVRIVDNDVAPLVWIEQAVNGTEASSNGLFVLKRSDATEALTVTCSLYMCTASYNTDYTVDGYSNGTVTVTFAKGSLTAEIPVYVKDDALYEKSETVGIRLNNPRETESRLQYELDETRRQAVLYIHDNEVAPNVWISHVEDGIEGSRNAKVVIKRDGTTGTLAVVLQQFTGMASSGSDFRSFNEVTVTFQDGSDEVVYEIEIFDDTVVERTEDFTVRLKDPTSPYGKPLFVLDQQRREATVKIFDNDVASEVRIDSAESGIEGQRNGKFVLKRTDPTHALSVNYTIYYNATSATYGSDYNIDGMQYSYSTGTATFAAGVDTVEIVVNILDDDLVEWDETITIRLTQPSRTQSMLPFTLDPQRREATILIRDDDRITNVWVDTVQHGEEGVRNGVFQLKRDDTHSALEVTYTLSGTATSGNDYTAVSGKIRFEAGQETVDLVIPVLDDNEIEYDPETIVIQLTPTVKDGLDQYHLVNIPARPATAALSIFDNDIPATVWIDSSQSGAEGGQDGYFLLKRDRADTALQVNFTLGGTASNGSDYTSVGGSATFAQGSYEVYVRIAVRDDTYVELSRETVTLLLNPRRSNNIDQYFLGGTEDRPCFAALTITDNDLPPSVWIEEVRNGAEGGEDGYFVLKRDTTVGSLRVDYDLSGTASNSSDYTYLNGYATFADTEDTVRIPITVTDDANFEIDPETVILSLKPRYTSNIPQYLLENTQARPTTATITIHDNETRPSVWIESSQDAVEGVLDGYFLLKRNTTVGSLRVDYTVSGTAANNSDYNNLNGQVTFLDGDDTVLIPITLREDTSAERTETVILTLGLRKTDNVYIYDLENTLERPSSATITITDNDTVTTVNPSLPSVWVGIAQDGEEGGANGYFELHRSLTTGTLLVYYSLSGTASNSSDYNYVSSSITFADGEATVRIPINVIDDTTTERFRETVSVTLTSRTQYNVEDTTERPAFGMLSIVDNDTAPHVWISEIQHGTEGGPDGYFRLCRDNNLNAVSVNYTLGGTASNGSDYTSLNGTVTFAQGEYYVDIPIVVTDDNRIEYDPETVTLRLNPRESDYIPQYYLDNTAERPSTAYLTITDNDAVTSVWIDSVQNGIEGVRDAYFLLKRDNADNDLQVNFTLAGSADGNDYISPGSSVTFVKGSYEVLVPLAVKDDALVELPLEIVTLTLNPRQDGQFDQYRLDATAERPVFASLTIVDNDVAQDVWIASVTHATEGGANGNVRLMRSSTVGTLRVNYSVQGTASHGSDYRSIGSYVTFAEGQDYIDIEIIAIDDEIVEYDPETIIFRLTPRIENNAHQYNMLNTPDRPAETTLSIYDNDVAPLVWIEYVQNGAEGGQNGFFRLQRDNAQNSLTVSYNVGGTATGNYDYNALNGSVTFKAGEFTVDIPVVIREDLYAEDDESVILKLRANRVGNHDQYILGDTDEHPSTRALTIFDNDRTTVWIEAGTDAVEGGEEGYVLIRRDNTTNALTVNYSIDKSRSTAERLIDFESLLGMLPVSSAGQVKFEIGQDTIRVPIVALDDDVLEKPESIVLKIRVPNDNYGYVPGTVMDSYFIDADRAEATVYIQDNEVMSTVWIETHQNGYEGGQNGFFRIRRDHAEGALQVAYRINDDSTATLGVDYHYPPGLSSLNTSEGYITFAAGAYYVDIPILLIDDVAIEDPETVSMTLVPNDSGNGRDAIYKIDQSRDSRQLTLYDNDVKPTVWVETAADGEEGLKNGYFRLCRDNTNTALTVKYVYDAAGGTATAGVDFAFLPGTSAAKHYGEITFEAGQQYVDIPVAVFDDSLIEGDETVRIMLTTDPSGSYLLDDRYSETLRIIDNDVKTTVKIDSILHGQEGVRDGYVRLHRDQIDRPLTIYFEYDTNGGSAVLGEDFLRFPNMPYGSNTASVTFDIGQHYVDIPLDVIDDSVVENTEHVLIRLHQGVDGSASSYVIAGAMTALVEIADNDEAGTVWIDSAQDAYEGETGHVRIYRSNTDGTLRVGFRFDSATATATFGDDFNFGGVYDPATGIGYVDFADGQEYVDLAVNALRDLLLEDDEIVPVSLLASGSGQYVLAGTLTAAVTIFDTGEEAAVPDAWRVGVFATDPYASENGPNKGEFTIIRTGHSDLNQPLTVRFQISGTAALGADYYGIIATYDAESGLWFGSFTFQAGQTHHVFTVTPMVDNFVEDTETIILTLLPSLETNSEGEALYTAESASSATISIEDAIKVVDPGVDPPVRVTWDVKVSATDPHASEDGTNPGEFTIVRSGLTDVSQPLTVGFRITGSATLNLDYTGIDAVYDAATNSWVGSITFAANQTHYVLNVTPLADELVEGTENVVLTLLPTEATTEEGELLYALGSGTSATVNIKDATQIADPLTDPPVRETWDISVIATDAYASEVRQNSGEFTIVRSGLTDLSKPLTVYFEITGTAAHNVDYTGLNVTTDPVTGKLVGSVTFQAGQKYVVLNVTPLLDNLTEGTENVVLTILSTDAVTENGQPLYAVDGTASSATVQIEDDMTVEAGNPWVSGDPEIREGRTYTLDLHDNEAGVIRWEVNWGDGSAVQTFDGSVTQVTHFYADGDENYTISIVAVTEETIQGGGEPAGGWQGLSHGYWKNHPQDWVFFNTTDNYEAVFGVSNSQKPGTLMQAIKTGGGQIKALWRESVAALQNATHPNIAYKFSVDEIIAMVQAAYATGEYNYYKDILETENTRHNVDINTPGSGGGGTGTTTREVRTELEKDVFVKNVAPDLTISGESKTLPNTAYVLHLSEYDPGDDTITRWTINWGDGVITVVQGNPSEATHIYTAVGDYTITATATDEDGTWNANTVDVRVYEPQTGLLKGTPWTSGDPEILEGRTYTLDLHANEAEILRWEITWGDGQTSVVDGAATKAEHFYADGDENYTISVVAVKRTESGTENVTMEQALLVLNVAPVLVISGSSKSEKGNEYLLNLSEYDPGDDTITSWTIRWGDGTVETVQGNPANVTHVYETEGTYTLTATATDEDGTWTANSIDVLVYVQETGQNTGIPFITGDPEILEGRTYTLDLHANEANILRWEITWGDGTSQIVEGSARYATHLYADGDENITITVTAVKQTESGPENAELTKDLLVKNVAPTLVISGPAASQPNAVYQMGLSSYDPGDDTIQFWTINWGDGIIETVAGDPSLATHVYASAGLYTITATATDEDGIWNANTLNIHIKVDAQIEWIKLVEGDRFVTDYRATFTVPEGDKAMVLDIRNLQFDGGSEGMINDAFEVALVDANGTPLVATIRTTRDGFLNITEGMDSLLAAGVLYDSGSGRIILDLSRIAAGTEATLIVRLVNNDSDTKTSVELNPNLGFINSPFGAGNHMTPQENSGHRQQVDFTHLTDVTSMIGFGYGTTTYNEQKDILRAGLTLTNQGSQSLRGPILVAVKNLSSSAVSVTGYDGMTPDGIYYFDVSHFAFSGQDGNFDPEEIIRGLDLQFLNPDHVQFNYEIVVLAHINAAPNFVSTPRTEISAGNEYVYGAQAIDPENDTLRYEKVFGPQNLSIDSQTGQIVWQTGRDDVGNHEVVIRVYDTDGLRDEQKFIISVVDTINRPPYFTTLPETEAFVGSIYRYQAKATDPDGDPLTYRLVGTPTTSDGRSLADFHATHHLSVNADGIVSWNPPAELVGKTISVVLEVSDPRGGTALQEFLIGIHADSVNHPPVIVTTPPTHVTLPDDPTETSDHGVQPGVINVTLGAGETVKQHISIDIETEQLVAADLVFVVDESGSMGYGQVWIQNMMEEFGRQFAERGINVRFALIGYASGERLYALNGADPWGDWEQMKNRCGGLSTGYNGIEDGYAAVNLALEALTFRADASKHIILVTDECRDNTKPQYTLESTLLALQEKDVTLHGIVGAKFTDHTGAIMVGARADQTGFLIEPDGKYSDVDGWNHETDDYYKTPRTWTEYIEMIYDPRNNGSVWGITQLENNDISVSQSFTSAFIDTLAWEVFADFAVDVVCSDPTLPMVNITGVQTSSSGRLVFEIEITGDGNSHEFELRFVNTKNNNSNCKRSVDYMPHFRCFSLKNRDILPVCRDEKV